MLSHYNKFLILVICLILISINIFIPSNHYIIIFTAIDVGQWIHSGQLASIATPPIGQMNIYFNSGVHGVMVKCYGEDM